MKTITTIFFALSGIFILRAQDFALKQLDNSPRHHEWINVSSGNRQIKCFVAYPEVSKKSTVIIVIHENRGLTDWVRSFADQLAAEGYITIAPDLLSDFSEEIKSTADFKNSDEARNAIYKLEQGQVEKDLNAVEEYASKIPAGNGKTVSAGFCWGGAQSFRFATYNKDLNAAIVFYGSAPEKKEDIEKITIPVYGFYAGNDERINSGIPATEKLMKDSGKTYDYKIYEGAGHAYMRLGEDPSGTPENKKALAESWARLKELLIKI